MVVHKKKEGPNEPSTQNLKTGLYLTTGFDLLYFHKQRPHDTKRACYQQAYLQHITAAYLQRGKHFYPLFSYYHHRLFQPGVSDLIGTV